MAKNSRNDSRKRDEQNPGILERTVKIKRCAAVVKGGRRFSFAAMVVCGDGKGKVGWGYGKANEVQPSVEKANKQAMRTMKPIPMVGIRTRSGSIRRPRSKCRQPRMGLSAALLLG